MTRLKVGDYYHINNNESNHGSAIVKITSIDSDISDYVFVIIIRVINYSIYRNWAPYAKYGISIPIKKSDFYNAKKLTHEEVVAIEL